MAKKKNELPGEAYVVIDKSDETLRFFRDEPGKYENGQIDGTKVYYQAEENKSGKISPNWDTPRKVCVEKVIFEDIFKPKNTYRMFEGMGYLSKIEGIEKLDTSNATNMGSMFSGCRRLTELDVSHFDTSKVSGMHRMFRGCWNLTNLDVSNFDTSRVSTMAEMFYDCNNLKELDLSNFHTPKLKHARYMFYRCNNLEKLDVSNFTTANISNMQDMFFRCESLEELDLSHWDTSNVTNMNYMFRYCKNLKNLNLDNFDTSNLKYARGTFAECYNINTRFAIMRSDTECYPDFDTTEDLGIFARAAINEGSRIFLDYNEVGAINAEVIVGDKNLKGNVVLGELVDNIKPNPSDISRQKEINKCYEDMVTSKNSISAMSSGSEESEGDVKVKTDDDVWE